MTAVWITCRRTIGMARNFYSTALSVFGFISVAAVMFSLALARHEGGLMSVAAVWTLAVSRILPILSAFLAMDVWSDEFRSGRLDMLMTVPVRCRDFVIGKFIGVWMMTMSAVMVFLLLSLFMLRIVAPHAVADVGLMAFLPSLLILSLQASLWCAVSVAFSTVFQHASAAACASVVLLVALPRGLWEGMLLFDAGRMSFGDMPFDVHAVDFASGLLSSGVAASYLLLSLVALFAASKRICMLGLAGGRARAARIATRISVIEVMLVAVLAVMLVLRLNVEVDLQSDGHDSGFSARTRDVLSETYGEVTVTAFMPRSDPRFRAVGGFLRALRQEALSVGASRFTIRFVDPSWDLGDAERLFRRGVAEDSLVFELGRRLTTVPIRHGYNERVCAAAIHRLITPPQRQNVYWTVGHGEFAHDDYGSFGMSDIARELLLEGLHNEKIDLSSGNPVPNNCALIIIAGARYEFSRVELDRLEAYLGGGGRLLVMLGQERSDGVTSLLSSWGIRLADMPVSGAMTMNGTDVVVSDFSDAHLISAPLKGAMVIMERPVAFEASATAATSLDGLAFASIASAGSSSVAVAVSRGGGLGGDLALRPSRIVAIGDSGFAINAALSSRANANRDFFLNCVDYLAGTDSPGSCGTEAGVLSLGMTRGVRLWHAAITAVIIPLLMLVVMLSVAYHRRNRK